MIVDKEAAGIKTGVQRNYDSVNPPADYRTVLHKGLIHPGLYALQKLWVLPNEVAHDLAMKHICGYEKSAEGLKEFEESFAYLGERFTDPSLKVGIEKTGRDGQPVKLEFDTPIIYGAGGLKDGKGVAAMVRAGYAGAVVGTGTLRGQSGNEHGWFDPRMEMVDLLRLRNWFGFKNPGVLEIYQNIIRYHQLGYKIGGSVGKNKNVPNEKASTEVAEALRVLLPAISFYEDAVSSPNTEKLRERQRATYLTEDFESFRRVQEEEKKEVWGFIKGAADDLKKRVAPDSNKRIIDEAIEVAEKFNIGLVITNTTNNPDLKEKYGGRSYRNKPGGLSGVIPELRQDMLELVAYVRRETGGRVPVMSAGGNYTAPLCLESMLAGAFATQVVTGNRIEGLTLPGRVSRGIAAWCDREGVKNISEVVGELAQNIPINFPD